MALFPTVKKTTVIARDIFMHKESEKLNSTKNSEEKQQGMSLFHQRQKLINAQS